MNDPTTALDALISMGVTLTHEDGILTFRFGEAPFQKNNTQTGYFEGVEHDAMRFLMLLARWGVEASQREAARA